MTHNIGALFVLLVYTVWGTQPLYWQLFGPIPGADYRLGY